MNIITSEIFNEETQLGRDIASIEEVFGQRDTYVLMVPRGDTATETALSDELHELPQITSMISYVDMAGAEIPLEYLDQDTLSQLMSEDYSRMVLSVDASYEGEETFSLVEKIRGIAGSYYPDAWYLAGEGVSTCDLMDTVTADMVKVNLTAIAAVFIVLLLTMKSVALPVILVLSIEAAIWMNLSCPHFMDQTKINVVNIFDGNTEGKMIDYGKYLDVRNMTTTDRIDYSGDTITILSSAEKLYYEGKLESTIMPWDIQIRYFLDGKEYPAEEIAGKSGEVKITIRITQHTKYQGNFYDNYALQASLSFDTDQYKKIVAPDATVANVGRNKQLTYTILPGKGADIEMTAEVSGFEMDGISINGIPLNLNVEVDVDDEGLMEQVTELKCQGCLPQSVH